MGTNLATPYLAGVYVSIRDGKFVCVLLPVLEGMCAQNLCETKRKALRVKMLLVTSICNASKAIINQRHVDGSLPAISGKMGVTSRYSVITEDHITNFIWFQHALWNILIKKKKHKNCAKIQL